MTAPAVHPMSMAEVRVQTINVNLAGLTGEARPTFKPQFVAEFRRERGRRFGDV